MEAHIVKKSGAWLLVFWFSVLVEDCEVWRKMFYLREKEKEKND